MEKNVETKLLISSSKTISIGEVEGVVEVLISGVPHKFDNPEAIREEKIALAHQQKRTFYKNFLSSHFENLIFLTGAGTSVGFGGKTMRELWDAVNEALAPGELEKLCKAIGFFTEEKDFTSLGNKEKDLERLLSRANIAKEFIKEYKTQPIDIEDMVKKAEAVIKDNCSFELLEESPHELFLNKITNRKLKDPRTKIFTLNYDTLFEQAAIKGNFTVIDGFSFSHPRTLSGRNFDYDIVYREKSRIKEEESFVPKVFHLYKPHGSVNWKLKDGKIVIESRPEEPLMIYPKDSKYENSYEQPFFEMMSRFQHNLRKDNVLLVCIGFSFNDKHIVTAIKEAVAQNPSFRLLVINRSIDNPSLDWFITKAKSQFNVTIVAEDFEEFVSQYPSSSIYDENYVNKPNISDE